MSETGVRVLTVDDQVVFRDAARDVITATPGFEPVGDAESWEEALIEVERLRPELVLLDVRMPGIGGVEAARRMLAVAPHTGVIMMTMAEDVEGVARAVNAGARGYLVKDASREELTTMVTQALADAAAARSMPKMAMDTEAGLPTLTERELQVLRGMGRGRSNAEIGKELYLSEDTVKTHARRLFRKLGAADRAQAVAKGFRWGLVR